MEVMLFVPKHDPALRERVFHLWAGGLKSVEIGRVIGLNEAQVRGIVRRQRRKDDPRCHRRDTRFTGTWTPEQLDVLARMMLDGKDRSEIGLALGRPRRQVTAKIYRLNKQLVSFPSLVLRQDSEQPVVVLPETVPNHAGPYLITELTKEQCRWPVEYRNGEEQPHRFCGAQKASGYGYCVDHVLAALSWADDRDEEQRLKMMCEEVS